MDRKRSRHHPRQHHDFTSSSSCLSLLSESDFLDDPSTSGCSSEMASHMQNREKKRQKVKEFLRELKAMVPQQGSGSKLGTLSTLDYVVSSMRKITEEQKDKGSVFKAPSSEPVALPSLQCTESVDFRNVNDGIVLNTQSELTVAVSVKNHVVLHTSQALMDLLGYPHVWWKGRLLKDFVHKKDIMTVNSYISSETSDTTDNPSMESRNQGKDTTSTRKQQKQFFYARIRRFRSLSSGFSLSSSGSYVFFKVMVTSKPPENAASEGMAEDQRMPKRCMKLYFAPMTSPYKDGQLPPEPEQRTFSLRHSLFCTYTYTHANTVALLGFLPQDIVGTSIFDYYHPDDLPQLHDIYKKAMHSMGQPFKSGPLRIRTRNGTYVKVTTEWSSFMNPWDHKLEFIIAQHTITKAPDNSNVFEEGHDNHKSTEARTSETSRKLINKITEILQKPMSLDTMPLTPTDSGGTAGSPANTGGSTPIRDGDKTKEKGKESSQGPTSSSDISSSIMDEKSISSLYNQVNYSLNIKKFLLSHPKAFPVSDEDSSTDVVHKDDSEEDLNEEEEVQVEIPVCRPPSCGSSTQVHVSEQGFHEEVHSPPSFGGEDPNHLTREALDNQLMLTEDSLRKHTKAQELLYLQEASKEQPHLFHLKSRRQVMQRNRQKRSRPSGHEETTDVFKFARNSKNQRGVGAGTNSGAPGLFMSNFPITAVDKHQPTPSQPANTGITSQGGGNMMGMMPGHFQPAGMGGMGVVPQLTMLPIDPTTGMTLQPHPHLQPFLPSPTNNMQWPYYPQSGYSLLPQVMAGFYQPLMQPVPMTPVTQASTFPDHLPPCTTSTTFPIAPALQTQPLGWTSRAFAAEMKKAKEQQKNRTDSDNPPSSAEDSSSSIQYLLDAVSGNNSSPNEQTDQKNQHRQKLDTGIKLPRRRLTVPPWLQTVNWTPEVQMTYKLPVQKAKTVLKKDREALKKMVQSEQVKIHLETLLEEVDSPDHLPALDQEGDYIFYPETRNGNAGHTASEEEEGEKTPRNTMSPTVAFDLRPDASPSSPVDNSCTPETEQDGNKGEASPSNAASRCMVVVVTEDPPEPMGEETSPTEPMNISETLKKVHSPASEGSNSSVKEGSAEGEGSAVGEGSTEGEREEGQKSTDITAMETKSPKDGSSSDDGRSDIGSDKGSENSSNNSRQKNEDAQSSSSKVSSNLTPSEARSMEDAGSSLKESDLSTRKGSFRYLSIDKMSTDSGAESASASTSTLKPDILEKLFVPLKVTMCHGEEWGARAKVPTLPFWQQEASMTEDVAMRYNLRPLDMATVLANDRRRLANMRQPEKVSIQLLELLHEMEGQGHKVATGVTGEGSTTTQGEEIRPGEGLSWRSGETSKLMQPPSAKHPRLSSELQKKSQHSSSSETPCRKPKDTTQSHDSQSDDSQSHDSQQQKEKGGGGGSKSGGGACLKKQLLDKLQSLTPGQRTEDWPGDVIMNKVFLPIDLVGANVVAETAASRSVQDGEIMDSVD